MHTRWFHVLLAVLFFTTTSGAAEPDITAMDARRLARALLTAADASGPASP